MPQIQQLFIYNLWKVKKPHSIGLLTETLLDMHKNKTQIHLCILPFSYYSRNLFHVKQEKLS
ncbi:hypothetical protein ABE54_30245 [Bacillus thuringiensis]|nr:hypothetical protein [Bacillus thuringiensis]